MRDYLSVGNLKKSLPLGALVALMAAPRIIQGGMDPYFFVPAAFFTMTLVAGAAAAWGDRAGMAGLFPGRRRVVAGLAAVVVIVIIATPLHYYWIDPIRRAALKHSEKVFTLKMLYPSDLKGCISLVLWAAGFEAIFFQAATMSFFARLTQKVTLALLMTVAARIFVMSIQLAATELDSSVACLIYVSTAASCLTASLLFARTGIIPTMAYCGLVNLHVFLFI